MIQNTLNPTSKVPLIFNSLNIDQKYKVPFETQSNLIVVPSKLLKNASHIPWHILYILPLRKEKWCILDKYWTKARLKPNPANIKAWSSTSRIWGFLFKGFGWLPPWGFTAYVIRFSLGLVPLPVCSSHWQMSHDSDVCNTGNLQGDIGFIQRLIRASVQGLIARPH